MCRVAPGGSGVPILSRANPRRSLNRKLNRLLPRQSGAPVPTGDFRPLAYEIEFLDGSVKLVGKGHFGRYLRRANFKQFSVKRIREIKLLTRFFGPMPPADIKDFREPEIRNLAKIGTSYGNADERTRAMLDAAMSNPWADWAKGVTKQ